MKKIITSIAAAAVLSTTVFAGTISLTDGAGLAATPAAATAVTFDPTLAANGAYNAAALAASGKQISYVPTVEIGQNYEITFTIANGEFDANVNWVLVSTGSLVGELGADTATNAAATVVGTVTDFVTGVTGYTSVVLTVPAGIVIEPTEICTLSQDGATDGIYSLDIAQGANSAVTVAVPLVLSDTGVSKAAPVAAAVTVLDAGSRISATFTNDSTGSIIDVNNGRLTFSAAGATAGSTTANADGALAVVLGGADKDFTLNGTDDFTLTLTGDFTGVTGMTLGGVAMVADVAYPSTTSYSLTSDFATLDLVSTAADQLLVLTTDGTTVLDTRTISADLDIVVDDNAANVTAGTDEHTLMANEDSIVLTINGYQAYSPYVISNSDTFTYVKIVNGASISSDVSFDTVDEDGNVATGLVVPTVYQGNTYAPLSANSTGTYSAAKILELAQAQNPLMAAAAGKEGKFAIKMTVNGAQANIYSTVVQTIAGSRERVFQVYHNPTGYLAQ